MRFAALLFSLLLPLSALAQTPAIYVRTAKAPFEASYQKVYAALEEARFYVVFEADIGGNLRGMKDKLGADYNRQGLEQIKVLVICNARYANAVGNLDPNLLSFCPLRVAMTHKQGETRALFERPTVAAKGSPAEPVLREVEQGVIAAIDGALR
jgi:uncharacterized protein (DUF302 family)